MEQGHSSALELIRFPQTPENHAIAYQSLPIRSAVLLGSQLPTPWWLGKDMGKRTLKSCYSNVVWRQWAELSLRSAKKCRSSSDLRSPNLHFNKLSRQFLSTVKSQKFSNENTDGALAKRLMEISGVINPTEAHRQNRFWQSGPVLVFPVNHRLNGWEVSTFYHRYQYHQSGEPQLDIFFVKLR